MRTPWAYPAKNLPDSGGRQTTVGRPCISLIHSPPWLFDIAIIPVGAGVPSDGLVFGNTGA